MSGNTEPIYPRLPDVQLGGGVLGPDANTALDGTGANITSIFQADATEGGPVAWVTLKAVGSPAATVARVFICSVTGAFTPGTSNTAVNTALYREITLTATTLSQLAASAQYDLDLGQLRLPPGFRLLLSFGTSTGAAGTGYAVSTHGGKY
jgi:hypothetical protein